MMIAAETCRNIGQAQYSMSPKTTPGLGIEIALSPAWVHALYDQAHYQ